MEIGQRAAIAGHTGTVRATTLIKPGVEMVTVIFDPDMIEGGGPRPALGIIARASQVTPIE